jgi:hypothetical protein
VENRGFGRVGKGRIVVIRIKDIDLVLAKAAGCKHNEVVCVVKHRREHIYKFLRVDTSGVLLAKVRFSKKTKTHLEVQEGAILFEEI